MKTHAAWIIILLHLFLTVVGWGAAVHAEPQSINKDSDVHIAFVADCGRHSDWQTLGMVFSWRESGQPGPITKVMCCTPEEAHAYKKDMLSVVSTHIAPSYAVHPVTGDSYAAYNKPEAVIDWLEHVTPAEEWVAVVDVDMLLRRPFLLKDFNLTKGWAVGGRYDYMIGVDNELADKHIPEIPKRNDTLAGPVGRRSDKIGGFIVMHRDDLKAMSKLWMKYTVDVRADPDAWHLTGDAYAKKPGDKPWISEMYGYSFGAAKANVWHKFDDESMLYPSYMPVGVPRILHYGLLFHVGHKGGTWSWDKHWYRDFDLHRCPPWNLNVERPQEGLFPPPPGPDQLLDNLSEAGRYRDLISISVVHTLNAALCEFHLQHCRPSDQLTNECNKAKAVYDATKKAVREMDVKMSCIDQFPDRCEVWAKSNECEKNPGFMLSSCRKSCKQCKPLAYPEPAHDSSSTVHGTVTTTGKLAGQAGSQADAAAAGNGSVVTSQSGTAGSSRASSSTSPLLLPSGKLTTTSLPSSSSSPTGAAVPPSLSSAAVPPPSLENTLRTKYPPTSLSFRDSVYRCATLVGLSNEELKDCIKTASLGLLYKEPRPSPSSMASGRLYRKQAGLSDITSRYDTDHAADAMAKMSTRRDIGPRTDPTSTPDSAADEGVHPPSTMTAVTATTTGRLLEHQTQQQPQLQSHQVYDGSTGGQNPCLVKALQLTVVWPKVTTTHSLLLWLCLVSLFLVMLPRLFRRRVRKKSGQRIE